MFYAIILPLYNEGNWIYLSQLFTDVKNGDAEFAFSLADSYNSRNPDGTYADNQTEAFISINCLDYAATTTPRPCAPRRMQLREEAPGVRPADGLRRDRLRAVALPRLPGSHTRSTLAGSADILVVGTTNDPATPYVWAQNMAEQLQHGHLVTYDGEGHTAYNKSNSVRERNRRRLLRRRHGSRVRSELLISKIGFLRVIAPRRMLRAAVAATAAVALLCGLLPCRTSSGMAAVGRPDLQADRRDRRRPSCARTTSRCSSGRTAATTRCARPRSHR